MPFSFGLLIHVLSMIDYGILLYCTRVLPKCYLISRTTLQGKVMISSLFYKSVIYDTWKLRSEVSPSPFSAS